jgi:predicted ester cyclase
MDDSSLQKNQQTVLRFNTDVIENGSALVFKELMDPEFVDRTCPPGASADAAGFWYMFENILRPALPDLRVEIHDQVAEGDRVTTRKTLRGTHRGALLGIAPTLQRVAIDVIDIVRLRNGRYVEHWALNTLADVMAELKTAG